MGQEEACMPHVLIFPYPAQGHVHPMLNLAKLISKEDNFYVTFLTTEHLHSRLLHSSPEIFHTFSHNQRIRFQTIPDGLSKDDPRPSDAFLDLVESLRVKSKERFREVLSSNDGWPHVTCVIGDGIIPVALAVPEEMEIPVMIFRTSSACSVWAYYSLPKLIERGEIPFPGNTDLDELVQGVNGMESFLRRRDLPGLIRSAKSTSEPLLQFLISISKNLPRAKALILNTDEILEANALSYIRSNVCQITYAIGPLQLFQKTYKPNTDSTNPSAQLWKEDQSCMEWLDRQPHKSVVYVSFGSIAIMSVESFLEFWHGLINSGYRFLWVIRPDMVQGDKESLKDVFSMTGKKCCLVDWAPQEEVLAHPAVGCFLTHSGWNSTLESMVAGVPMICWPFIADQQINSRFVNSIWKNGIDMKDTCESSVIEKLVRNVMTGNGSAINLQKTTWEVAKMLRTSVEEGGSSNTNFQKLIKHIKSLSSPPTKGISNEFKSL